MNLVAVVLRQEVKIIHCEVAYSDRLLTKLVTEINRVISKWLLRKVHLNVARCGLAHNTAFDKPGSTGLPKT